VNPGQSPPALRQIVGAAVVDSLTAPTALLVARRTAPEQFAGMWEFPGGKVENGESCTDALHRELLEELGIRVVLGAEVAGPVPGGWQLNETAAMRVWLAEVSGGTPGPLQDHDELRWIPLSDVGALAALPWIPADRPIVDALVELTAGHRG
jgi:8-oxo-dGTP diphosphatase